MTSKIVICLLLTFFLLTVSLAQAQQPNKIPRIGYLTPNPPSAHSARYEAFRQGLRELGYVEGKNIVIEYRYAEGKQDRVPGLAAEMVDVIVTGGSTATRAAKEVTVTIPIVMASDPNQLETGSSPALRGRVGILLDCQLFARN